jgi:xylan 1,4-beta-xylosidase
MSYRNPVIPGFHPDPSVCRVGEEYFLVTSSFTYFPGVPVFRSQNLVEWSQIGNVLDRRTQVELNASSGWSSLGIYAPTIRYHDNRFWMITTNRTERGRDTFFVTSSDPVGPWSDPVHVDVEGIDPDLTWDGDGNCWVHSSSAGIVRSRIDEATGDAIDRPVRTWSGTGLAHPEAPHLYERDGIWYLLISEGGTERGHAISIARATSPEGPWEACPRNPILSHRSLESPIQNAGHGDLIEATDGSWWLLLLGVRPRGITPGFHVLGREVFLAPVEWVDGWPQVGHLGPEVDCRPPGPRSSMIWTGRDDFDQPILGSQWLAVRRPPSEFANLAARPGWLTLAGSQSSLDDLDPVFVARRQQHHECRVRALVEAESGVEAGISVRMDEYSHYEVAVIDDRIIVRARIGPLSAIVGQAPRPGPSVVLSVETRPDRLGPDTVVLGFEDGAATSVIAELDGRYLSTEVAGGFIGRVIGMYARGGEAAFDWFEYAPVG